MGCNLLTLPCFNRTITEGKIYVEVERARLTHKLAMMKEAEGDITEAATILQELQVETFGSMERKEKASDLHPPAADEAEFSIINILLNLYYPL